MIIQMIDLATMSGCFSQTLQAIQTFLLLKRQNLVIYSWIQIKKTAKKASKQNRTTPQVMQNTSRSIQNTPIKYSNSSLFLKAHPGFPSIGSTSSFHKDRLSEPINNKQSTFHQVPTNLRQTQAKYPHSQFNPYTQNILPSYQPILVKADEDSSSDREMFETFSKLPAKTPRHMRTQYYGQSKNYTPKCLTEAMEQENQDFQNLVLDRLSELQQNVNHLMREKQQQNRRQHHLNSNNQHQYQKRKNKCFQFNKLTNPNKKAANAYRASQDLQREQGLFYQLEDVAQKKPTLSQSHQRRNMQIKQRRHLFLNNIGYNTNKNTSSNNKPKENIRNYQPKDITGNYKPQNHPSNNNPNHKISNSYKQSPYQILRATRQNKAVLIPPIKYIVPNSNTHRINQIKQDQQMGWRAKYQLTQQSERNYRTQQHSQRESQINQNKITFSPPQAAQIQRIKQSRHYLKLGQSTHNAAKKQEKSSRENGTKKFNRSKSKTNSDISLTKNASRIGEKSKVYTFQRIQYYGQQQ